MSAHTPMASMPEVEFYRALGRRIRQERVHLGWSQQRLADALGMYGVAVHYWETGRNRPDLYTIRLLERAMGVALA